MDEAIVEAKPPKKASDRKPLVSLLSVERHFQSSRYNTKALDQVTLHVDEGEFVCIVGPSGCGKSTLLNLVAGLDKPDGGSVLFDDAPVRGPSPERVVVFQEPALFPWLNVRTNVEFGLKIQGISGNRRRQEATKHLDLVNLRRSERAYVHELSGGMKQRVQLARALAVQPRMLLMDEPFAALDAQTRDILQQELQEIWSRVGTTILFVTHNVQEAALLADRIIVMTPSPGRIKKEIPVDIPRPRRPESYAVVDAAAQARAELEHDVRAAPPDKGDSYVI